MNQELEQIKENCTMDCGCWLWNGGIKNNRVPYIIVDQKFVSTRRYVAKLAKVRLGKKLASTTCGDRRCVCPDHIKPMTQSDLQKRKSQQTKHQAAISRRLKLRSTKNAVLNIDKAREIRAQQGIKSNAELSKEYGVSKSQIYRVLRNAVWIELENPFYQLMSANSMWSERA